MRIVDVNVLLYAYHPDFPLHSQARAWLHAELSSESPLGISELVLAGVIRIATNQRVRLGGRLDSVLNFVADLHAQPNVIVLNPGPQHWHLFLELCRATTAHGKLVADAYHAALAIETSSELITFDRDFARFPGLRSRAPF